MYIYIYIYIYIYTYIHVIMNYLYIIEENYVINKIYEKTFRSDLSTQLKKTPL